MASIKHKIAMYCKKNNFEMCWWFKLAVKINYYLFHRAEAKVNYVYGEKNPDKTFYIIRGNGREVGLCSHFITVLNEAYDAVNKGYIPVVDFRHNRTQYNMPMLVNNTWNAWEYYFEQLTPYSIEEVEESKNIVISDPLKQYGKVVLANHIDYSEKSIKNVQKWAEQYIHIKDDVNALVNQRKSSLFDSEDVLGVFCRGTDYVSLRPKGHPVQPNVEQVINKTKEFLEKHLEIKKIFLATEDYTIYEAFKNSFGNMICVSDFNLVKNYDGKDYLCNYLSDNKYEIGLNYIVKMMLLSECSYIIASKASGSYFSMVMKKGEWKERYIFELGVY